MDADQLAEWRISRMKALAAAHGGKAALGRALGYRDGAFVGHMLSGHRPITEKTMQVIEALPGRAGWFDMPKDVDAVQAAPQKSRKVHTASLIPETAAMFSPSNLSAAVLLIARLLESMDARSRKTMGEWLMDLALSKDLAEDAADIAYKAEGLAARQRISKNPKINEMFSGKGAPVETSPTPLS